LINSDLHFNNKLGHGVLSMVWKGTYREEVVAIKVLQFEQNAKYCKNLENLTNFTKNLEQME